MEQSKINTFAELCFLFPKLSLDNQEHILISAKSLVFAQEHQDNKFKNKKENLKNNSLKTIT